MTWSPSQPRLPAGQSTGGQWGSPRAASAAKKKKPAPAAKAAATGAPKMGPARDAAAAKIQQDDQAKNLYAQAMGMGSSQRTIFLKKLSPDQLEKLTAILYSFPTSDKSVVAARIAVANEMTGRGIDIKKYGALGGGLTTKGPSPRKAPTRAAARKAPARPAPSPAARAAATARATSQVHSTLSARAE